VWYLRSQETQVEKSEVRLDTVPRERERESEREREREEWPGNI